MKKLAILAVALLLVPASAMAGMTAFMNMDELSSNEMATVTGQTGITIQADTGITGGTIGWTDDNGFTAPDVTTFTNPGVVTIALGAVTTGVSNILIDAGTKADLSESWIAISTNSITINATVNSIKVGTALNNGASMGKIQLVNLALANTQMRISGH